jgi:hypothetical protein
MLAPFKHFIVNFPKSYLFKVARADYVCLFWLDSSSAHWVDAEWDSLSTESTQSETPRQLSQCSRHQHLRRFHHSALTQLTWSLTPRWPSWGGVTAECKKIWSQQIQEQNQKHSKALFFAYICLISAKKQNKKSCARGKVKKKTVAILLQIATY